MLILAFDVGTETLPSLALGRDPIEPGSMQRPPRPQLEGVIQGPMLVRAWLFLGVMVSALSLGGFFYVLHRAGWHPGDPVGAGRPLHHAYLEATTMTFAGMIAGQIGTAFAVRTRRASLRSIGVFSNPYLLGGIAGELALAAVFIYRRRCNRCSGPPTLPLRRPDPAAALPIHRLGRGRAASLAGASPRTGPHACLTASAAPSVVSRRSESETHG